MLTFPIYLLAELKASVYWLGATELIVAWPQPNSTCPQVPPGLWDTPMKHVPLQSPCLHGTS